MITIRPILTITIRSILLALAATVGFNNATRADEVTEQLESATASYVSGELRNAVATLNFAIAKIQERMTADLQKLLPEPLTDWQADPADVQSGGMAAVIAGTTLSRRYIRADGAEVNLSLMADSPLLPMWTMAMSMPFAMRSEQDTKTYSLKGHRGTLTHAAASDEYEIALIIGSRLMIQAKGRRLPNSRPVEEYLEALDLTAIQQALID